MSYYFTSESVGEGHPDKIADKISDGILDECLRQDKESRVAVETLVTKDTIIVAGEVTTQAKINYKEIIQKIIRDIGYNLKNIGFDSETAEIIIKIHEQSPDISQGVSQGQGDFKEQGAGDQGIMFGFACNETLDFFPLAINLANKLVRKAKQVRINNEIKDIYSDCKSQVTIYYENEKPKYIDSIVFSIHHSENISLEKLREEIKQKIIFPVCKNLINKKTKIFINPTGRFVSGGPAADTGLTGRKIIVDTYGGYARHGGGCFSGKDPSKVDRSAAYMARYITKNIVASGLADKCELQLSYAIGYANPLSIHVETFGTEKINKQKIENAIKKVFELTPKGIINTLNLKNPIYQSTAFGGHFGRKSYGNFFTWEKTDKIDELKKAVGLK